MYDRPELCFLAIRFSLFAFRQMDLKSDLAKSEKRRATSALCRNQSSSTNACAG